VGASARRPQKGEQDGETELLERHVAKLVLRVDDAPSEGDEDHTSTSTVETGVAVATMTLACAGRGAASRVAIYTIFHDRRRLGRITVRLQ
jgi:hypothetical protein